MFVMARHPKATLVEKALAAAGKNPSWLAKEIGERKQKVYGWLSNTMPRDESVFDRMLEVIPPPARYEVPDYPPTQIAETTRTPTLDLDRPRWLVSYQPLQMRFAGVVPASSDWGDPLASEEMIEVDARYEHPKRFAAQLVGSSCWPALHQGDLTIWHTDEAPASGLIILAQNLPEHECTVKQLRLDSEGQAQLVPVNPNEKAPPIGDAGWYPIARLVAVIRAAGRVERSWYNPAGLRAEDLE